MHQKSNLLWLLMHVEYLSFPPDDEWQINRLYADVSNRMFLVEMISLIKR